MLFNPLDILMYIDSKGYADDYWVSTSSNRYVSDVIRNTIKDAGSCYASELMELIEGKPLAEHVDTSIFYDERTAPALDISILVHSGYLMPAERDGGCWKLSFPNKEVRRLLSREFLLAVNVPAELSYRMSEAIESGDAVQLKYTVQCITERVRATVPDRFRQAVTASVAAALSNGYSFLQEAETDKGRLILLKPCHNPLLPDISLNVLKMAGSSKTCRVDVALNGNDIEIVIE